MSKDVPQLSLKQLELLTKKPIVEAEGLHFWKEFTEEYSRLQKKHPAWGPLDLFVEMRSAWLKDRCPPIEFAGQGSSRAAFALDGGLCLKIAVNGAGVAQNEAEWSNISAKKLSCFVQPYYKADDYSAILVEAVSPLDLRSSYDAAKLLGVDSKIKKPLVLFDRIADFLWQCGEEKSLDAALELWLQSGKKYTVAEKAVASAVKSPKTASQKALRQLAQYVAKNRRSLDPDDLASFKNWGFAARNGKIVLVVLDAGYNDDVAEKWYSSDSAGRKRK